MTALRICAALAAVALATPAAAQAVSGAPAWTSQGFNGAASTVTTTFDANSRDGNNNRVVINGEIQTPGASTVQSQFAALAGGAMNATTGAGPNGAATAVGNMINIQVNGSWNTVVLTANQTNNAAVSAQATSGSTTTAQQKVP